LKFLVDDSNARVPRVKRTPKPDRCAKEANLAGVGRILTAAILIMVDLPAPFSPTSATTSPWLTVKSRRFTATTPANAFVTPFTSSRGPDNGGSSRLVADVAANGLLSPH
jgi:hypothetical protein